MRLLRRFPVAIALAFVAFTAEAQGRLTGTWLSVGGGTSLGAQFSGTVVPKEVGGEQCVPEGVNPGATYSIRAGFKLNQPSTVIPVFVVGAKWFEDAACTTLISRDTKELALASTSYTQVHVVQGSVTAPAGARSVKYQVLARSTYFGWIDVSFSNHNFAGPYGSDVLIETPDGTTVCPGGTVRLRAIASGGSGTYTTYNWYLDDSIFLQGPDAEISVQQAGTYKVSVTDSVPSTSPSSPDVVVTFGSVPVIASVQSNSPVCIGRTIALTASATPGATYSWTGPNSFASTEQNPTILNAMTTMSGSYFVTVTLNGCTSPPAETTVTVNSIPQAPSPTNSGPKCEGDTVQLTVPYVVGATWAWTGPNGFTSPEMLPTLPSVTLAMAGDYTVTVSVENCASAAGTTTVAVNPNPITPVITAPTSLSPLQSFTASVPDVSGVTYAWTVTNGAVTAGSGTRQVTVLAGETGPVTISVTVTNTSTGCVSAEGTVVIPVALLATGFYTVAPCRLYDTRESTGPSEAWPALAPGETRTFFVGTRCGLESSVLRSLSVNQTVTQPTADGEIVLYRGDLPTPPITNSLSYRAGKTRANNGLLELSRNGDGTFKVHNRSAGSVHFILDVNGYFQ